MPIYLFLVKHEFIFSVKKLMISLIEKAPYMLSPPFFNSMHFAPNFSFPCISQERQHRKENHDFDP
ncbi:hypothetical protein ECC41_00815 [Helicobacter pylori]|nr:hypothetical protein ECC41_00815 [Helicobacter pylori]